MPLGGDRQPIGELLHSRIVRSDEPEYRWGMNKIEREFQSDGPAELEYLDGEYRLLKPGSFVYCAVTGEPIPLDALRYWSVDLQEAYASPAIAVQRLRQRGLTPK